MAELAQRSLGCLQGALLAVFPHGPLLPGSGRVRLCRRAAVFAVLMLLDALLVAAYQAYRHADEWGSHLF